MKKTDILPAWGRVLRGDLPFLSIEITKECPLRCPGCYANQPGHSGSGVSQQEMRDLQGRQLIDGVLALVRRLRPLHVSIVGGEPLVRYRELDVILPELARMKLEVQLVTSAVRPIPARWSKLPNLHLVVSIDGLPPEHDRRRSPATYERILRHVAGHRFVVHCTVIRQFLSRSDYLHDFAGFWSERREVQKIWFSLFTPQEGPPADERLSPADRVKALEELAPLPRQFPKVYLPEVVLDGYRHPPLSPKDCIFAQVTDSIAPDLAARIAPCQLGGQPVCGECGCIAAAGLAAIGKFRLFPGLRVSDVFILSKKVGGLLRRFRGERSCATVCDASLNAVPAPACAHPPNELGAGPFAVRDDHSAL